MKDYLKALRALQRIHSLLQQGSEVDVTTIQYYIDDYLVQFKMQFGEKGDAFKAIKRLEDARAEAVKGQVAATLQLISDAGVLM